MAGSIRPAAGRLLKTHHFPRLHLLPRRLKMSCRSNDGLLQFKDGCRRPRRLMLEEKAFYPHRQNGRPGLRTRSRRSYESVSGKAGTWKTTMRLPLVFLLEIRLEAFILRNGKRKRVSIFRRERHDLSHWNSRKLKRGPFDTDYRAGYDNIEKQGHAMGRGPFSRYIQP